MSTLGVITNPTSGSGRGQRWGSEALTLLAGAGHRILDLSRGSWAASYEAALKHRRDMDALVVVGGDGMVHLGLQVCAGRKLPLGIVAAGSGNDVALTLGLPVHDVRAAVAEIQRGLDGAVTRMDLGRISGAGVQRPAAPRYFGAVLSAGIDAAVAAYGSRLRYPKGPLKYKVATFREIPRFKPYGARVTIDGVSTIERCTLVAVANGPVFGGGLRISPSSSVTDGLLDVVLAEPLTRREIVRIFPKLYDGSHLDDPRLRVVPARSITIAPHDSGAPLPPAFADGELVGPTPLEISVKSRALRVLGGLLK